MPEKQINENQLRTGDELPLLARSYDLVRGTLNEDARTVEVTFSTENPVERWFGNEILDHSPGSVRMERMDGAPFLMDHSMSDQRGVVESAEIRGKQGRATVRFSKSARGQELMEEVRDGIRTKISVGYRVHRFVITENNNQPDEYRAIDWEPMEISSVAIGADIGAKTRAEYDSSQPFGARAVEMATRITVERTNQPNQTSNMAKPDPTPEENENQRSEQPPATPAPVADDNTPEPSARGIDEAEIQRLASERAAAEIERREEIRSLGTAFGLSDDEVKKAIRENASPDSVKLAIIERQRTDPANAPIPTSRVVVSEPANGDKGTRSYMEATWGRSALEALKRRGFNVPDPSTIRVIAEPRERSYVGGNDNVFHRSLTGALTLADVAVSDAGIGAPIIEEITAHAPELSVFPVDVIAGATVELSVLTGLPTVGARNANEGTDWKKGVYESRIFQTAVIEERIGVDIQGVLNASRNPGRLLASEAMAVTRAVAQLIGAQTWYGATAQSGADAKFSPGIYLQTQTAATHVVDATGTTGKTSVWFLELGTEKVDHVYGNDTTLNFRDMWEEETIEDANGKKLRALTNYLSGRVAPRVANKNAAVRIKNVSAETNKTLTDSLMYSGLKLCEDLGMNPNAIFMTSRSAEQLRDSRTTYHPLGLPSPRITDFEGIPVYVTRNLSNAETI